MAKLIIKNRYGIIPNELLNNPDISLKAKGLYGYLQSKPDNWKFSANRISYQNKEGIDAIRRTLQELEGSGYLERKLAYDKQKKRISGYDYTLYGKPIIRKSNHMENQSTGFQNTFSKKDNSKKDTVKKSKEYKADKSATKEIISYFYEQTNKIIGIKPEIGKKDAGMVEMRLKKYPAEKIKSLIDWYLNSKVVEKLGATLSTCLSNSIINQWKVNEGIDNVEIPSYAKGWQK